MNYFNLLSALAKEISDHPKIKILAYEIEPPLPIQSIAYLSEKYKTKLSKEVIDFYIDVNGFYLKWKVKKSARLNYLDPEDYHEIIGEINILDLGSVLGGLHKKGWVNYLWFEDMKKEKIEDRKKVKPFDFVDNHESQCICFEIIDEMLQGEKLTFFDIEYGVLPFDANIKQYIDLLTITKGFIRWQEAYAEKFGLSYHRLVHYLPQLFPDEDISDFMK